MAEPLLELIRMFLLAVLVYSVTNTHTNENKLF